MLTLCVVCIAVYVAAWFSMPLYYRGCFPKLCLPGHLYLKPTWDSRGPTGNWQTWVINRIWFDKVLRLTRESFSNILKQNRKPAVCWCDNLRLWWGGWIIFLVSLCCSCSSVRVSVYRTLELWVQVAGASASILQGSPGHSELLFSHLLGDITPGAESVKVSSNYM